MLLPLKCPFGSLILVYLEKGESKNKACKIYAKLILYKNKI